MSTPDVSFEPGQPRPGPEDVLLEDGFDVPPDWYDDVDVAPTTPERLVTRDVSAGARRDRERLRPAAAKIRDATASGS